MNEDWSPKVYVSDMFDRKIIAMNWRGFLEVRQIFDVLSRDVKADGPHRAMNLQVEGEYANRPEIFTMLVCPDGDVPRMRDLTATEIQHWKATAQSESARMRALELEQGEWHPYPGNFIPTRDTPYLVRCSRGTKRITVEASLTIHRGVDVWRTVMGPVTYKVTHFRPTIPAPE